MTEFNLYDKVSAGGMLGTVVEKTFNFDEREYVVRFSTGYEQTFKGSQLEKVEAA